MIKEGPLVYQKVSGIEKVLNFYWKIMRELREIISLIKIKVEFCLNFISFSFPEVTL